jgi:guanylate cyclase
VKRAFLWLRDLATRPTDTHDERLQKRLQIVMAAASVPTVALWGLLFVAQGHAHFALWHLGFCVGTLLLLVLVGLTRNIKLFRLPHPILVMLGPFGLHWQAGGFRGSGGAMLWCLLAPIAAMMFVGAKRSLPQFIGVMVLAGLAWLREGPLAPASYELTPQEAAFHFTFNTIGFVAFLYLSTRYFVSRIDFEKARSDRLLLNVLPAPIAERLKKDEGVIADRFESVTVLFTDIVGFTPLSAKLPARELVLLLDEIFSAFDRLADQHGLEKIKTIGDAYMAVGGLPEPTKDHAPRVARAALAMLEFIDRFSRERNLALSVRVGLHSGEVAAGVIGRKKFSYDLWGDTVNTASRMESHGAPGRVHMSEPTRALLGDEFRCSDRGPIQVKGKGEMRCYWLDRDEEPVASAAQQ